MRYVLAVILFLSIVAVAVAADPTPTKPSLSLEGLTALIGAITTLIGVLYGIWQNVKGKTAIEAVGVVAAEIKKLKDHPDAQFQQAAQTVVNAVASATTRADGTSTKAGQVIDDVVKALNINVGTTEVKPGAQ